MRFCLSLIIVFTLMTKSLRLEAQKDTIPYKKVALYGGIVYGTSMLVLSQAWYAENGFDKFKFFNDNAEWNQIDKFGHAYGTYQLSRMGYDLLSRTELTDRQVLYWAGVIDCVDFPQTMVSLMEI